jgi:diguanylate cyclase (GGDEF)-like protein
MTPTEDERLLSELDQDASEIEQSGADLDQTHAASDQESSDRDQVSADHDQMAADLDQNYSPGKDDESPHEKTRRMRVVSARERIATSHARHISSEGRNEVAHWRDQLAAARDTASAARDALATSLDAEIERLEQTHPMADGAELNGLSDKPQSLQSRVRAHAALQRAAAAQDREMAAKDRAAAARDRQSYTLELASLELDELTGALRRGPGLAAVQREISRTHRTGEKLTLVFIDVDRLKQTNDANGHAAGDALLRTVVRCVVKEFRSYDLIFRLGGDEFVCAITGNGLDGIASRFDRIAIRLHEAIPGATISIGVSERQTEDTVDSMIERADGAMISRRQHKGKESQSLAGDRHCGPAHRPDLD